MPTHPFSHSVHPARPPPPPPTVLSTLSSRREGELCSGPKTYLSSVSTQQLYHEGNCSPAGWPVRQPDRSQGEKDYFVVIAILMTMCSGVHYGHVSAGGALVEFLSPFVRHSFT